MARALVLKELYFETKNEAGLLGRVTAALAVEGVYIIHLSAYSIEHKAYFKIITKDNHKSKKALAHFIPSVQDRDVLIVEFENKVGTLAPVAKLLGNHGIGIHYVYGTSGDGFKIVGIFSTTNNDAAANIINEESGAIFPPSI